MIKNKAIGSIVSAIGGIIVIAVLTTLYYMNAVAIWIGDSLGASEQAGTGIQVILFLISLILLFSVFIFGILIIVLGISYIRGVTPFDILKKIHTKVFGDF